MATRTIRIDQLTRVEGEGAVRVRIRGDRVASVALEIFEAPRLFEALLGGRDAGEVPDIVARICGICPVAYQMSAVHALEPVFGVTPPEGVRALRRLLYCAEWIESHVLHIYMLHAPDFLGFDGAIEMAAGGHRERVERGLALRAVGNDLLKVLGGRAVHPVSVRLGGFHRAPAVDELTAMLDRLRRARELAIDTVRWVAGFEPPPFEREYEFVALRHPDEYPMNEGRIVSSAGLDIAVDAWEEHFEEVQVPHSNALHARIRGRGHYVTGPLARVNLNFERLSPLTRALAAEVGFVPPVTNPYRGIVARALEVLHACDEAIGLVEAYRPPSPAAAAVRPRAGTGHGCTEAPRGVLYHRYTVDDAGTVLNARIVPPTAQNQPTIEDDLGLAVGAAVSAPDDTLRELCARVVRNYDPCISCATHAVSIERS